MNHLRHTLCGGIRHTEQLQLLAIIAGLSQVFLCLLNIIREIFLVIPFIQIPNDTFHRRVMHRLRIAIIHTGDNSFRIDGVADCAAKILIISYYSALISGEKQLGSVAAWQLFDVKSVVPFKCRDNTCTDPFKCIDGSCL